MATLSPELSQLLHRGIVIPAHPLALTSGRALDVRCQRALTRYYCAAGAGGVAVGVHTTQFKIHDPAVGLLEPVLALASETADAFLRRSPRPFVKIAGLIGLTGQALREAELALRHGYHAGLLSLAALGSASDAELLTHCQAVAARIPIVGFYLQPAVGGRVLGYDFWRRFAEIENVVAIKIAPFNRYQTLDVVRAVVASGRQEDIALYTGNDDNILADLLTDFVLDGESKPARIVGGLLGQWAVWTKQAVEMLETLQRQQDENRLDCQYWLRYGAQITAANSAIFDATHGFRGCIPGIHYILQRQGLVQGTQTLNPREVLSAGQTDEIERVCADYPHLTDDLFVAEHRQQWLEG